MNFRQFEDEDRRLSILLVLKESGGYRCNEYLLRTALDSLGHAVSRDRLMTDLSWLAEQGHVATETVANISVATLSARGLDVASGRTIAPGVKRPAPE